MSELRIGVIVYDRGSRPDAMLADLVPRLKLRGLAVGGLLQEMKTADPSCCATLQLEDIATRRRVQIFEQRAPAARGCRLDPAGLAEAASWLREAIAARPDVLLVNRFGRQEAEGRGLVAEIGAAAVADLPVLVAVGEALLGDWVRFAGGEGTRLQSAEAVEAWCLKQARAKGQASASAA